MSDRSPFLSQPAALHPWEIIEQRRVHANPLFTLRQDRCRSPTREIPKNFYVLETCDWVNVIPLTPAGQVVLVEQFRHGSGGYTLEIPGGMVDAADPSPLVAGMRELREETGYAAAAWRELGYVLPNPAIQNNRCFTFLAEGAVPTHPQQPDLWEEIQIRTVPLDEIPLLIRQGVIRHALVVAAFYWLALARAGVATEPRTP